MLFKETQCRNACMHCMHAACACSCCDDVNARRTTQTGFPMSNLPGTDVSQNDPWDEPGAPPRLVGIRWYGAELVLDPPPTYAEVEGDMHDDRPPPSYHSNDVV